MDTKLGGGSYVTSTPELERATLENFLHGHEQLSLPASRRPSHGSGNGRHSSRAASQSPAAIGLYPTSSASRSEAVKAATNVPFPVLSPTLQTGPAEQQTVRPYALTDQQGHLHHAYVAVWRQNIIGGYYDFEGTDSLNPPLFTHAPTQGIHGRSDRTVDDG